MKQPRHYASAYILAKGDKEAEREALKGCPKEWQELVRTHIRIEEARREYADRRKNIRS